MKEDLKYVFDINQNLNTHHIVLVYRGKFTYDVTAAVLNMAEHKLAFIGEHETTKKKVFNVMVECLQNICKHSDEVEIEGDPRANPLFIIGFENDEYTITSGNAIFTENVPALEAKLKHINDLDKDGLRAFYMETLSNGEMSEKGGAGLGFIDMVRKSGNKLVYYFEEVDEKTSFFILKTKVSRKK